MYADLRYASDIIIASCGYMWAGSELTAAACSLKQAWVDRA